MIASIQKASQVLKVLAEEPYNYSVMEVSKLTGINRTTVHRILMTLKEEDYVYQSLSDKKYRLGPMTFHLGQSYTNIGHHKKDIIEVIDEVSKKLKMSTGYAILDNGKIINLYENELFSKVRLGYNRGVLYPYNCGAYGKTIMAYQDRELVETLLSKVNLKRYTDKTITDKELLFKEYEKIVKQGYTISDSERIEGAFGVGAPIRNNQGIVTGAICAAGIKSFIPDEQVDYIIEIIVDAANRISRLIP